MALNLTRSFTYATGNTITASENNTNENTLYNAFSGLEATTSTLAKLKVDADPTAALEVATKQYVDVYATWKRPELIWISVTTVDVNDNTGTANQTRIIFPDGNYRSVTEDTGVTTKYRRFDITATAEFTSGTEDSGLRSGISEANNTWYAIYAVKSTINTANFVLAGDTTLPLAANFSTLNTRYGTNGWVYLGLIRNGDGDAAASSILTFEQSGNKTEFYNTWNGNTSIAKRGMVLTGTGSGTSASWTYAGGTGTAQLPQNIVLMSAVAVRLAPTANRTFRVLGQGTAFVMYSTFTEENVVVTVPYYVASQGISLTSATDVVAMDAGICGFTDGALGVGSNPLLF